MKIFYHDDLDGQCSARIIYDGFAKNLVKVDYIPMQYEKDFPFDILEDNEEVYILDYSIEPSEMKTLLEITHRVTWIDHHKTAIKKYEDFPVDIPGIREVGKAGCELTFEYLKDYMNLSHDDTLRLINVQEGKHYSTGRMINFINMIGDWDVWRFDFGENTREFHYGLLAKDTDPESPLWNQVKDPQGLNHIIEIGQDILGYEKMKSKEYVERFGFETEFEGYKTFVCNIGNQNSMLFGDLIKEYDICATYVHNGDGYVVSLYSEKIDTSKISNAKGGGGHAGASGFTTAEYPF